MITVIIFKAIGALVGLAGGVIGVLVALNNLRTARVRRRLSEDKSADIFTRQFNKSEITSAIRGYLIPNCSPSDPTNKDGEEFLADTREPIFSYLDRNLALPQRTYHLLLADTGMGKTVFSLNYYNRCKTKFKHLKPVIVSLASKDAQATIKAVINKPDAILIADALDEDPLAIKRGRERLSEILEAAADFKAVIITCRSQFFLSDDAIPRETPLPILLPRKLGQQPNFSLVRSYISPFSQKEVRKYINKHFPVYKLWKFSSRRRAFELAKSVPDLAHRPMLLERFPKSLETARAPRSSMTYMLF